MIIEILLALFLVLVLRLLDGWVERRRDVLHYVTKPSRGARDNAGRLERELVSAPSRLALKLREAPTEHRRATSQSRASLVLNPSDSPLSASHFYFPFASRCSPADADSRMAFSRSVGVDSRARSDSLTGPFLFR
jgi:hypothetical protein